MKVIRRAAKFVFFLLFFFPFLNSFSQNYRLIDPHRIRTYTKRDVALNDSAFFFVKVDAAGVDGLDSVYYFNRLLDTTLTGDCYAHPGDTTLLGPKMLIRNDSDATHIFFNRLGDSIFVKTLVNLGDEWHVYTYPDGSYVKAHVINKLFLTVLPPLIEDTVIRIKLNVYTSSGIAVYHFPNETKMDITEDYGLIEFWPVYNFPYDSTAAVLRGISDPDSGIVDVDAYNAFDFSTGNEFHYQETECHNQGSDNFCTTSFFKYFVLDKNQYDDSVSYHLARAMVKYTSINGGLPDTTNIIDTLFTTYRYADYGYLDSIELTTFHADKYGYNDFRRESENYLGRSYKLVYDYFDFDAADSCLINPGNFLPEQTYGDGLGILHYFDSTDISNYDHLDMVYFQKGLDTWGNPIDFDELGLTAISNSVAPEIKIYPNPAENQINVSSSFPVNSAVVINQNGIIAASQQIHGVNSFEVGISNLTPGVYYLKITGTHDSRTIPFIKM